MKLNKIFISGLAVLALSSCNDFLDVEPDTTKAGTESAYDSEKHIETALNGVYAKIVADNLFGNSLYNTFQLNSDVDFHETSSEGASGDDPRRFDVRSEQDFLRNFWNALYTSVETANEFIYNLKNSPLYDGADATKPTTMTQKMGEAKVIRAMLYHELLWYFGDIPFTMQATYETDNLLPEVTERQKVSDALIEDLQEAAELMYSDKDLSDAPERISQEAAYAMIARLALQAGGYSLNHEPDDQKNYKMTRPADYQKYYEVAREYTKRIIDADGHKLGLPFREVFVNECNFVVVRGDDAIFEIPFAKETSGRWGYIQGPKNEVDAAVADNYSNSEWGETNPGVGTSIFYPYTFDRDDLRRDYICGMWSYSSQGVPSLDVRYKVKNNKWSKLWNTTGLGKQSTTATGINFAYIRYADVLLMFAEAENELNGPTADAQEALKTVRRRAFNDEAIKVDAYVAAAASNQGDFLKAVLDERKWEFAGENMRWKDLVRNNMYSERVFMTFLTYYSEAERDNAASFYTDAIEEYEAIAFSQRRPDVIYSAYVKNMSDPDFPNNKLYMHYVYNRWEQSRNPKQEYSSIQAFFENTPYEPVSEYDIRSGNASKTVDWIQNDNLLINGNTGEIRPQALYSLYGYIRVDNRNNIIVMNNGVTSPFSVSTTNLRGTINSLPPVRYILPYPQDAIARSNGVYKNYYSY